MADPTTNYGWDLPDVGADQDTWGAVNNVVHQNIDDEIKLREDEITATEGDIATAETAILATAVVADAALPVAGGVMTGRVDVKGSTEQTDTIAAAGSSETIDFASAAWHKITLTEDLTLAFSNIPNVTGSVFVGVVEIIAAGFDITWSDVDEWAGGTAPTLTAKDVVVIYAHNGTTPVVAFRIAQYISECWRSFSAACPTSATEARPSRRSTN